MIYLYRRLITRGGRLQKRHEAFQEVTLSALEDYGSVLLGAWEVVIGPEAGCSIYQLRQFEGLADWEKHQERLRQDRQLTDRRQANLYTYNDFAESSVLQMARLEGHFGHG